jgi:putative transposase
MRSNDPVGVSRRKAFHTVVRDRNAPLAPDRIERDFCAPATDRLWVADITYLRALAGFVFLAPVLDAFSRLVVGWAMVATLRPELVLDMALAQRRPAAVIDRSDHSCQ